MPEAPEVHNAIKALEEQLLGKTIEKVVITHPKLAVNLPVEQFERELAGQRFEGFKRHGKFLVFILSTKILVAHLRMEGRFLVLDDVQAYKALDPLKDLKHIHAIFQLTNDQIICYKDTRKFGRFYLYDKTENWKSLPVFKKIGPDVMDPDLDVKWFMKKCRKKSLPIKSVLLDQSVIAGIGNIYADEILFESGISPFTPASHLDEADWQAILDHTRTIMKKAAAAGGSTIRSFSYGNNHAGTYQDQLKVHGQDESPCPNCSGEIIRTKIGGRSTWYCPECQKEK